MSGDFPKRTTAQDRLPKSIGPYFIRERIGKGAMGVVYRATDEGGRNEVALKVMASDLDGDPETRERFFREAHVAGKLRHPNIVSVKDSGEDNGRLFIAMELLRGATLTELLKQPETLDLEDRIDLMIQVCQGLRVAHNAGVFHRDLKPANLFVCEDRRVKILDFGVARLVGSNMTVTGNIIGTPDFMSPEQVRGEEIDGRSDIFSAGSVFYLLVTGRKPFAASDLPAVLNKVARAQPLPIRETEAPEAITAVIRKALAKDPAARQQDINELACELMAAAMTLERSSRRTALAVRTLASDVIHLDKRCHELAASLEVPESDTRAAWLAVQEQFPVLKNGIDVLGTYPVRSRVIQDLHDAIGNEREALHGRATQLEEAHAKYLTAKRLHASGAHEQALKEYDAARRIVPSSNLVARAIEECAEEVRKIRERDAQLQARLTLATQAAQRGDWEGVLAVVKDLEAIDASSPVVARLREEATRNLEAARTRQAQSGSGRKTAADSVPVQRSSGRHTAAQPGGSNEVSARDEERDGTQRTERTARGAQLRQEAVRHLTTGDLAAAERIASEAVTLNSGDKEARHLLERVRAAITLRTQQQENANRVHDLLARADALVEKQQFDEAIALCDQALEIDPTHVDGIATRARIAEEQSRYEAEHAAAEAKTRRLRAAAPALKQAQRAFDEGDFERARWSAENALALAPDWHDAQLLLERITVAIPAPSADDTVKLNDPQSDETAELAPMSETFHQEAGKTGSSWMRRWRSSDAGTKGSKG